MVDFCLYLNDNIFRFFICCWRLLVNKKQALMPKINMENWFEDNGIEAIETISTFMKIQQEHALALTKLVLDHCKFENITKERIFEIFTESTKIISEASQDHKM